MCRRFALAVLTICLCSRPVAAEPLRIATFRADVTPPLGSPLGYGYYGVAKEIVDPLSARGIVILSDQQPIVLCAVDWIGLNNAGHDIFRDELARAAGTSRARVNVHCLHPHDAPGVDLGMEDLLTPLGLGGKSCDPKHARAAIAATAAALAEAIKKGPRTITHLGIGKAKVEQVASNRRIIGPDGKSKAVRWSATRDPKVRAEPEGLIDPYVQLLSFWNGDQPLASITYYATHPQSHYGKGGVSCDFPGLARGLRDAELPGVAHIHFNGAGGNITAGKYNDGNPANRRILTGRLAAGMKSAWDNQKKAPITPADLEYRIQPVTLPAHRTYDIPTLREQLADAKATPAARESAARLLARATRMAAGHKTDLTALRLGSAWVLHMPGELFVEYQLAAQKMRPDATVCMAAYGDLEAGYIGTARAYAEGGYEPGASRVTPAVEKVLMDGMRELLK